MAGRPSVIDQILRYRNDGTPITVADQIVNALRAGSYFETACASAGIHKETAYGWLRTAARLRLRARGVPLEKVKDPKPTAFELRCVRFSDAVAEAESSWEVGALATLEQLARGGTEVVIETKKTNPEGVTLETTTRTETLGPNPQVIEWRLERRFPARYGRRVEVSGPDGGPMVLSTEDRAEALAETLTTYLQGVADARPRRRRTPAAVTDGADEPGSA